MQTVSSSPAGHYEWNDNTKCLEFWATASRKTKITIIQNLAKESPVKLFNTTAVAPTSKAALITLENIKAVAKAELTTNGVDVSAKFTRFQEFDSFLQTLRNYFECYFHQCERATRFRGQGRLLSHEQEKEEQHMQREFEQIVFEVGAAYSNLLVVLNPLFSRQNVDPKRFQILSCPRRLQQAIRCLFLTTATCIWIIFNRKLKGIIYSEISRLMGCTPFSSVRKTEEEEQFERIFTREHNLRRKHPLATKTVATLKSPLITAYLARSPQMVAKPLPDNLKKNLPGTCGILGQPCEDYDENLEFIMDETSSSEA